MILSRNPKLPASGVVLLFVILFHVQPAQAGYGSSFQRISTADGLSQAAVYSIVQDRSGFMWFGTQEGLNRYDGITFKVFSHDPLIEGSLPHDLVWTIHEDDLGQLWVGTDNGLARLDAASGEFHRYRHDPADLSSLSNNRIRAIQGETSGVLWIGTEGGGLNRLDRETGRFMVFEHDPLDPSSLSSANVTGLCVTRDGDLWVGTDSGLDRIDTESLELIHYRHEPDRPTGLSDDRISFLYEDRGGALWIGTDRGGLDRLDKRRRSFTHFRHDPDDANSLSPGPVRSILEDSQGRLWIGTDDGLNLWQPAMQGFRHFRNQLTDSRSLSEDRVISLYEDRGGVLWVGTWSGLNKRASTVTSFGHEQHDPDSATSLSSDIVTSFAEDLDGSVWVGTYSGLDRLDRGTMEFTNFRRLAGDPSSLSDDRVMSLLLDRSGVLWVGTREGGLNRFDRSRGTFTQYRHEEEDPSSIGADGVTCIFEDTSGNLWVGTYGGGLNRLDRISGVFDRYRHDPADASSISSDRVLAILEDSRGNLFVGTDGGGLNLFDPATDGFEVYRHEQDRPTSLSNDAPWTLFEDAGGELWIGTRTGLNRWSAGNRLAGVPVFDRYGRRDGLRSATINGILGDMQGNLWLSTNRGVSRFDPRTERFRHYGTLHGLQGDEFHLGAFYQTRDGEMFFGGSSGFNHFRPERIQTNEHAPPVVFTSLRKLNQPHDEGLPLSAGETVELSHKDYVVAFEFAVLDYSEPAGNRATYRLEGFDRDWIDAGSFYRATYTNLPPGRYVLRVRAANSDEVWNEEGASLSVFVAPPPWRMWWAYSSYLALTAAALMFLYRDQARRRERALELERANRDLKTSAQELRKLSRAVEQSPAGVVITDRAGRIDYVNRRFEEVTGYTIEDLRGENLEKLQSGYTSKQQRQAVWETVQSGGLWHGEFHSRKKNGELFWERVSVSPILSPSGETTHLLAINEDITVKKANEDRLVRQAQFDDLTELPNRTLALDRLSQELLRIRRDGGLLALMFLDLDNFKIVNDTLGHAVGDHLLVAAAKRLEDVVRDCDTVARFGGDEFLIVAPGLRDLAEAETIACRILECFAEPLSVEDREIFVSASLGVTVAPVDASDAHVLLRNADAAMYRAKEMGRDTHQFFTPEMNQVATARLQLESGLRQALSREELSVEFQPVVHGHSRELVAAEAVLRWHNPTLGIVPPADFIPLAEENGLIVPIGEWVLEEACREAKEWEMLCGIPLRVSVNISWRQARSGTLVESVSRALQQSGLDPSMLELEITERVLVDDTSTATETFATLHRLGVRLAIDDFGTGYSSLSYLQRLPFDLLKIDRSFVGKLLGTADSTALVRAIIAMADSLDLDVIAEGVEKRDQVQRLASLGCDLIQGFYFSRPLSPDRFREVLCLGNGRIEPLTVVHRAAS